MTTTGVGNCCTLPLDSSLRGDIGAADADSNSTDNIRLVYDAFYPISDGQIDIAPDLPKTLDLVGSLSQPVVAGGGARRAGGWRRRRS